MLGLVVYILTRPYRYKKQEMQKLCGIILISLFGAQSLMHLNLYHSVIPCHLHGLAMHEYRNCYTVQLPQVTQQPGGQSDIVWCWYGLKWMHHRKKLIQDPAFQHCLAASSGAIYVQLFGKDLENQHFPPKSHSKTCWGLCLILCLTFFLYKKTINHNFIRRKENTRQA